MSLRRVALLALAAFFVLGVTEARRLRWVCDDSFISFRYADNLVHGHGLVFNPGERVEGYSNLLWTLAIAGLMKAGLADPLPVSAALGIASYAALAAFLGYRSWRRGRDDGRFLPLAAMVLLTMNDTRVWATGGLETMTFSLFAAAALLLTREGGHMTIRRFAVGVLLSLLVLTRPDGILFALCALLSDVVFRPRSERPSLRQVAILLAPVALSVAGLLVFKLSFYGEWLPTAFYSKSATSPYWRQGIVYLTLFIVKNGLLAAALMGLFALAVMRWSQGSIRSATRSDVTFLLGTAALFVAYVLHSGGDFMFARRLIPVVPLVLVAVEDLVRELLPERAALGAALIMVAAAACPIELFDDANPRIAGIADERRFYPPAVIDARRRQGEMAGKALEGTNVRALFGGGMCVFAYYSRLPYLVEMTGLTQYSLARRPLPARGHVGHEKTPDAAWLTDNHIHLIFQQAFPPIPLSERLRHENEIVFGDLLKATIWEWSDEVMDHLAARPDVYFRRGGTPEVFHPAAP